MGVCWSVADPWRARQVAARLGERGGVQYSPQLAEACHRRKRPVWGSWRMDESALRQSNSATSWPRHPVGSKTQT
jgi:transposase-like protein